MKYETDLHGCVRLPEWTGMDYRNGLLNVALSACNAFYMHRMAHRSHRE